MVWLNMQFGYESVCWKWKNLCGCDLDFSLEMDISKEEFGDGRLSRGVEMSFSVTNRPLFWTNWFMFFP